MRKRRLLLTAASALLLVPALGAPARAAVPQQAPTETFVTSSYLLTGPEHFDKHGNPTQDHTDPAVQQKLAAAKSAARKAPPGPGPAESHRRALADGATYGTPSERFAEGTDALVPDDITPEECRENSELSGRDQGWIKNHFSYCWLGVYGAVQARCLGFVCVPVGGFSARITLIGVAYNGLRNAEMMPILDEVDSWGTADAGAFTFEAECHGNPAGSCVTADDEVTRTPEQWEDNGKAILYYYSPANTPSESAGEQVAYGTFDTEARFRFPQRTLSDDGPSTQVRFDSAWYLAQKNGSIFNLTDPWLSYDVNDQDVKYSAWNIHNAQKFPAQTEPIMAGKHLPGGSAAEPLHRMFKNKTQRKLNRTTAVRYCNQRWPGYAELGQDCDEYPFACTAEGAATGQYAVRPIPAPDNQEAGRRLGSWFSADRIIDGDAFHVRIFGAGGSAPEPPGGAPTIPDDTIDCGDGAE